MSYRSWTVDGYGICIDDMENVTAESIVRLVHMAPKFESAFTKWLNEMYGVETEAEDINNITMSQIEEYSDENCYSGIGPIILKVMSELEHIQFILCDDYNCHQYILYMPKYPWDFECYEHSLKQSDIDAIFGKYVSVLTSASVPVDYYYVENGG